MCWTAINKPPYAQPNKHLRSWHARLPSTKGEFNAQTLKTCSGVYFTAWEHTWGGWCWSTCWWSCWYESDAFRGAGGEETETKGVRSGGTVKDARKVMSRWSLRPRPHPTCLHAASPVHAQIPDPTFHLRTQSVWDRLHQTLRGDMLTYGQTALCFHGY